MTPKALCFFAMVLIGAGAKTYPRRTDIKDLGHRYLYRGWTDVQGQGVDNDYCRFVGSGTVKWLSCALAGTQGESEYNYNPPSGGRLGTDPGYNGTFFMDDKNGDGLSDFCRCVGIKPKTRISCMLANKFGFECNQYGYNVPGSEGCS